ncbi:MAG: phosphotriesterase [Bryobacteraceae bacterium]
MMTRREFVALSLAAVPARGRVMTVRGPVAPAALGALLPHEHLMSAFGEEPADTADYDREALAAAVLPYLAKLKKLGCGAIADCTAARFGRDPALLRALSEKSGLHVLTNTGYYGAAKDRYVPPHAFEETPRQIAARWTREWREGIAGTGIRPGLIKLGVDPGPLSAIDRKLVEAGAIAHRETGLAVAVHTGDSPAGAREQIAIFRQAGVSPRAWMWVHANNCKDDAALRWAAEQGAWLSFDGLDAATAPRHLELVQMVKKLGRLDQVLLSHDGNSFRAGRPPKPYDALFTDFIPRLRAAGFASAEIRQLTQRNPQRAFTIEVRT